MRPPKFAVEILKFPGFLQRFCGLRLDADKNLKEIRFDHGIKQFRALGQIDGSLREKRKRVSVGLLLSRQVPG
jgi:hypothetical protein